MCIYFLSMPNRSFLIYYRAKFTWLFRSYLFTKRIECREVCILLMWNVSHLQRSSERSCTNFHFPFLHIAPKMSKKTEKITISVQTDALCYGLFAPFSLFSFFTCLCICFYRFLTLSFTVGCILLPFYFAFDRIPIWFQSNV